MLISSKTVLAAVAGFALTLTLAACGGPAASPSPTPTDTPSATPSDSASPTPSTTPTPITPSADLGAITVSGEAGAAPTVTVPAPWAIDQTRRKVLTEGNGPAAEADSIVEVNYVGTDGRTGQVFDSSWAKGKQAIFSLDQVVPGFTKGLTGAKPGERVLIGMPGPDGYDPSGGNPQAGIQVGDSLVFLVDVLAVSSKTAVGAAATPKLPVTVGQDGGKPTVSIPAGAAAPTALVAESVIVGAQRPVVASDYVLVHYRSWSWKTGQMIEDVYDTPEAGQLSRLIPAWQKGLVGKPIGSRVIIVAPPAEAYPNGNATPAIEAGDTLVYAVDILFSSSVAA